MQRQLKYVIDFIVAVQCTLAGTGTRRIDAYSSSQAVKQRSTVDELCCRYCILADDDIDVTAEYNAS